MLLRSVIVSLILGISFASLGASSTYCREVNFHGGFSQPSGTRQPCVEIDFDNHRLRGNASTFWGDPQEELNRLEVSADAQRSDTEQRLMAAKEYETLLSIKVAKVCGLVRETKKQQDTNFRHVLRVLTEIESVTCRGANNEVRVLVDPSRIALLGTLLTRLDVMRSVVYKSDLERGQFDENPFERGELDEIHNQLDEIQLRMFRVWFGRW